MIWLKEGEKRTIRASVRRLTGEGAITLTSPQRRILTAARTLVAGFDWAAAAWVSTLGAEEISTLFDSTAAGLTGVGFYFVQLRGVIGAELYGIEIKVEVLDWGP